MQGEFCAVGSLQDWIVESHGTELTFVLDCGSMASSMNTCKRPDLRQKILCDNERQDLGLQNILFRECILVDNQHKITVRSFLCWLILSFK